jgi:hypothetical protein
MRIGALLIGLVGLAIAGTAQAQDAGPSCAVFKIEQTQDIPSDIVAFFALLKSAEYQRRPELWGGVAVERCKTRNGNTVTSFLGPTQKYVGVCHFGESDISDLFPSTGNFRGEKLSPITSLLVAPKEWMLATDASCPRQDDNGYVFVQGVSPGLFRQLFAAYTQLFSAPAAFDAALSEMNRNSRGAQYADALRRIMQGHPEGPDVFLSATVKSKFGKPARLLSINYAPAFYGNSEVGRYAVALSDGWDFEFDFTQTGLKVVEVSLATP